MFIGMADGWLSDGWLSDGWMDGVMGHLSVVVGPLSARLGVHWMESHLFSRGGGGNEAEAACDHTFSALDQRGVDPSHTLV